MIINLHHKMVKLLVLAEFLRPEYRILNIEYTILNIFSEQTDCCNILKTHKEYISKYCFRLSLQLKYMEVHQVDGRMEFQQTR